MKQRSEGGLAFSLLFLLIFFYTKDIRFVYLTASLLFLSMLSMQIELVLDKAFKSLIGIIGKINSVLILSLIFILVLTPMSIFYKLFNKKRADGSLGSYFESSSSEFKFDDFNKLW